MHSAKRCSNLGALQGKFEEDVNEAMLTSSKKLAAVKDQKEADEIVLNAMKKGGKEAEDQWEKHHIRKLDTLATVKAVQNYKRQEGLALAGTAQCSFNVLEAFVSAVGMGDDINAIIRTCPSPRDGESELACQVNGGILGAWVGNLATKLSLAASYCASSINVDAICSAGVNGLVSVMGELAATASLAAATCTGTPPQLTTTQISVLGDQTVRGRRLLIGEGAVGNGVQCMVDVGMVASNIANMGLAINSAVNSGNCNWQSLHSPLNKLKGIPEALCTVDIGGAVAYIGQVVTFINLIVVHCQDLLDVNALCAGSIAGITTSAAAVAPYGAAVHAACRYNALTKNGAAQAKINSLYDVPDRPRRLEELAKPVEEAMANLKEIRKNLEAYGVNRTQTVNTQADMEKLLHLMGREKPETLETPATRSKSRNRRAASSMSLMSQDFAEVEAGSSSERETQPVQRGWTRVKIITGAVALLAGVAALASMHSAKRCSNLGALQGKFEEDVNEAMLTSSKKLAAVKDQKEADEIVLNAMKKGGKEAEDQWEKHHIRKLDTLATVKAVQNYKRQEGLALAGTAQCSFNVLEAFVSAVGMGDDINAIIRTCPSPRDGESELACQVNGGILGAWVGNLATKLSLAASYCASSINVDAICSAGVNGLVSVMGELAATASLAAATCTGTPPQLTTTQISVLGDQTVRGRRLLIGEGAVGNGVQCMVDVGMVASNIANMGLAINSAVNSGNCNWQSLHSPLNKLKGIPEALCTVDIGGAVAYIGQVVTFINLIVVHCQDLLDVNALCAGSIAGITTSAAAVAPYGAAVHAACRYNALTKNGAAQAKINSLYDVPDRPRRLEELAKPVEEAMANLKEIRKNLEAYGVNRTQTVNTQADMEKLLHLMGREKPETLEEC
ncbi:unnamed protein product [Effrenium voratum]|uniref:Uncharacterized protein n=1 Tax=Effrenium voratum TaxID=2562239 RepID=A0AA36HZ40_9DINO|nr:unnamed protein product [Effrenium voratum]